MLFLVCVSFFALLNCLIFQLNPFQNIIGDVWQNRNKKRPIIITLEKLIICLFDLL